MSKRAELIELVAEKLRKGSFADYPYSTRLTMAQHAIDATFAHIRQRAKDDLVLAKGAAEMPNAAQLIRAFETILAEIEDGSSDNAASH